VRNSSGYLYRDARGRTIRDAKVLERIASLAIPPAYTEVWISPDEQGHLQATGRDVRGRKQYRYHPRWREVRDQNKYGRMVEFGEALPRPRRRVARDMARSGMPREKVLAALIRLLETTLIRIGNEEYLRANHSFGLTTLRNRHVAVKGSSLRFTFKGKGGIQHNIAISDPRVARIVRQCQDIPGQQLFQYIDDLGERRSVASTDINAYLQEIAGADFTAKDFRTWAGTLTAARELRRLESASSPVQRKQSTLEAIRRTARQLGNTPAICRKCYVHPEVLQSYIENPGHAFWRQARNGGAGNGPHSEEVALLRFLRSLTRRRSTNTRLS
jgi:DNA topoisomerase-1